VIAPELGEVSALRLRSIGREGNNSARRVIRHPITESSVVLPLPMSHQKDQLAAVERQAYALRPWTSPGRAKAFDDVDSIDQRLRHRVNPCGIDRMTCAIRQWPIDTHDDGQHSTAVNAGVTTIGNADRRSSDDDGADRIGAAKSNDGAEQCAR